MKFSHVFMNGPNWPQNKFVTEECPEGFICESELPFGELYENYHILSFLTDLSAQVGYVTSR